MSPTLPSSHTTPNRAIVNEVIKTKHRGSNAILDRRLVTCLFTSISYILISITFMLMNAFSAHAQSSIYGADKGFAIDGYDTVSYFLVGQPIKGKSEFSSQWKGATWQFANAENLATFEKNPEKFAPQYGGHCAMGMAHDALISGDPLQWNVVDHKLYLNTNRLAAWLWRKDKPGNISAADKFWPANKNTLEITASNAKASQ